MSALTIAEKLIEDRFPHCNVALLAGSAARNELTELSDLDIIIVDENQSTSIRECFCYFDWNIEVFIYNPASLSFAFGICRLEGIPWITQMCAEGIILKDNGTAEQIQVEAKGYLENGPAENKNEKDKMRYMITDLLDDLYTAKNEKEKVFVANNLFDLASNFILKANNQWIGYGKWTYRYLNQFDSPFCEQLVDEYRHLIKTGNSMPFITLIEKLLKEYGDRLFEGYKEFL